MVPADEPWWKTGGLPPKALVNESPPPFEAGSAFHINRFKKQSSSTSPPKFKELPPPKEESGFTLKVVKFKRPSGGLAASASPPKQISPVSPGPLEVVKFKRPPQVKRQASQQLDKDTLSSSPPQQQQREAASVQNVAPIQINHISISPSTSHQDGQSSSPSPARRRSGSFKRFFSSKKMKTEQPVIKIPEPPHEPPQAPTFTMVNTKRPSWDLAMQERFKREGLVRESEAAAQQRADLRAAEAAAKARVKAEKDKAEADRRFELAWAEEQARIAAATRAAAERRRQEEAAAEEARLAAERAQSELKDLQYVAAKAQREIEETQRRQAAMHGRSLDTLVEEEEEEEEMLGFNDSLRNTPPPTEEDEVFGFPDDSDMDSDSGDDEKLAIGGNKPEDELDMPESVEFFDGFSSGVDDEPKPEAVFGDFDTADEEEDGVAIITDAAMTTSTVDAKTAKKLAKEEAKERKAEEKRRAAQRKAEAKSRKKRLKELKKSGDDMEIVFGDYQ